MSNVCQSGSKGKDPRCVFPTCLCLHCLCFLWVSWSGFGSSFLPKEESVTAAPEVEVIDEYQSSSQVCLCLFSKSHSLPLKKPWIPGGPTVTGECGVNKMIATVCKFKATCNLALKTKTRSTIIAVRGCLQSNFELTHFKLKVTWSYFHSESRQSLIDLKQQLRKSDVDGAGWWFNCKRRQCFIKKYNQHTNTQQRLEWSPVQRDADV